jgi:pentose-5-phosphate-3-epimerase
MAGATILVAGSAVFNKTESVETAMKRLRDSIQGGPRPDEGAIRP